MQKGPDRWSHRDELLFQVVHQSSELWLKLARRVDGGGARRGGSDSRGAALSPPTPLPALRVGQLDMLEQMSPWDYQEIRKVLGTGGIDSPGWRGYGGAARLGRRSTAPRDAACSIADVYVHRRDHERSTGSQSR